MRKAKREMPAEWALEVFDKAPYITVGMTKPDGTPYCLPLSLVRTDEKTFYFHCAMEGEKLDCIKYQNRVCLSAVTKCKPTVGPKDDSFTLQFRSAVAKGMAEIVTDEQEKIMALKAICMRFLPSHIQSFDNAIARSLFRTCVVKIVLEGLPTGKRKEYNDNGEEKTQSEI
ncbi:MAG: pyridoxamine 5'-phosphate oxidase family protein [Bacteroidales bacterium]|nr:pyridoxamine 5'-phosphate oxidase family protein [Bacteroidales bacterium]